MSEPPVAPLKEIGPLIMKPGTLTARLWAVSVGVSTGVCPLDVMTTVPSTPVATASEPPRLSVTLVTVIVNPPVELANARPPVNCTPGATTVTFWPPKSEYGTFVGEAPGTSSVWVTPPTVIDSLAGVWLVLYSTPIVPLTRSR